MQPFVAAGNGDVSIWVKNIIKNTNISWEILIDRVEEITSKEIWTTGSDFCKGMTIFMICLKYVFFKKKCSLGFLPVTVGIRVRIDPYIISQWHACHKKNDKRGGFLDGPANPGATMMRKIMIKWEDVAQLSKTFKKTHCGGS